MFVPASDERLAYWCPQVVDRSQERLRLERFPRSVADMLAGQIGPLANLRSSSGCAVVLASDSPWVTLHLSSLRHHQMVSQGVSLEIADDAGWRVSNSLDLRERDGDVAITLATGLVPGQIAELWLWMPTISTAAIAGISIADHAHISAGVLPEPRWLALGDSLTQGFSVQSPVQTWVHRLMRRRPLPAWNLGVGGLRIEASTFAWALRSRTWDLVTIGLGSNHAWKESDLNSVIEKTDKLLAIVRLGGPHGPHRRVVWCLPPWKPCEDGKGPSDFAGVPLTTETGDRVRRVRHMLQERLAREPDLILADDLLPHDARLFSDGLHPSAFGFARYADALEQVLASHDGAFPSANYR